MNSRAALVWGKVVLQIPRALFGMLGWLTVGALLPRGSAWALFVVLTAGGIASLVAGQAMVRLIWWAWRTGRSFDGVTLVVTARHLPHTVVAGPRILVVPRHIAAYGDSLGYARALQGVAATRWDVLVAWLAWPWDWVATAAGWIARKVGSLPLVGWAWSIRWLVAGIAVIQSAVAGRFASSVVIAVVVGLTYWMPWSRARWLHAAHAATLELMPPTDHHRDLVSVGHSNQSKSTGVRHHDQAIGMPRQRWHDRHEQICGRPSRTVHPT